MIAVMLAGLALIAAGAAMAALRPVAADPVGTAGFVLALVGAVAILAAFGVELVNR